MKSAHLCTPFQAFLPVEGDLITLAFECKGEEQFFYDWLNEAVPEPENVRNLHFVVDEMDFPVCMAPSFCQS